MALSLKGDTSSVKILQAVINKQHFSCKMICHFIGNPNSGFLNSKLLEVTALATGTHHRSRNLLKRNSLSIRRLRIL